MIATPPRPTAGRTPRRRLAVLLVVALALPLAVTACAQKGPDAGNEVNLSIFWWGGPAREELTRKALALYTKRHPNVTFTMKTQPNAGYYDALEKMIASGNGPDLFQIDDNKLADFVDRDLTLDLTPYFGSNLAIDSGDIPESLVAYGTIDRKPHAVAIAENTPGMVYDKTVVKQYNLPEPEIGWSYEELISWAAKISTASDGKVGGTVSASSNYKAFWLWLRAKGKEFYLDGQLGFSVRDLQEWFELWVDAGKAGAVLPADAVAGSGDVIKQPLVRKKAATAFLWSNQIAEVQKATNHELGITAYPGDPRGQWARASMYWAIHRGSKQQAAAADVINFLINDTECGKILGTDRGLPANQRVREAIAGGLSPVMRQAMTLEAELAPRFGPAPPPPPTMHKKVTDLLSDVADTVVEDNVDPEVAAYNFVTQARKLLGH